MRTAHFKLTLPLSASSTYCATCAFVRITPFGSMITPLPEIGCTRPPEAVQRMFTVAARARLFAVIEESGGIEYGSSMRRTVSGVDVAAAIEFMALPLVFYFG